MHKSSPNSEGQFTRQLTLIIVLALLYFVSGRLGLLLAIPPGYATAVWPASGIALIALLLYGNKLWPGILIGSFLVNVATSYDPTTIDSIFRSLLLAISVGIGAALQALAGATLIKHYIDTESGLSETRDILLFLSIGGPISCIISATWGVSTLWLTGLVSQNEFPFSWMTWWVGDSIGVLLVVPLLMCWVGHPKEIWQQRKVRIALPLSITLILVVTLFVITSQQEQARIDSKFKENANQLINDLEKKLLTSIEVLYSIQNQFNASDAVDKKQFNLYTQRALKRNPAIQALGWNPVLTAQQRSALEKKIQAEGFPEFMITERDSEGNLIPAGKRDKYVAVLFIEPFEGNEKAFGYDVYSNVSRRQAMDQASSTGQLVVTDPIRLVQETSDQAGVIFFLPVYHSSEIPPAEQREAQLRGFSVGVFRIGDLLIEALKNSNMANIDIQLSMTSESGSQALLASYSYDGNKLTKATQPNDASTANSSTMLIREINLGQRSWFLEIKANPQYLAQNRSWVAWSVLTGGLLFTVLLGIFLLVLLAEKNKFEQAQDEINTLRGIIPICSYCKQIRDDEGSWNKLDEYIRTHTDTDFSHGICPDCTKKHFPKLL